MDPEVLWDTFDLDLFPDEMGVGGDVDMGDEDLVGLNDVESYDPFQAPTWRDDPLICEPPAAEAERSKRVAPDASLRWIPRHDSIEAAAKQSIAASRTSGRTSDYSKATLRALPQFPTQQRQTPHFLHAVDARTVVGEINKNSTAAHITQPSNVRSFWSRLRNTHSRAPRVAATSALRGGDGVASASVPNGGVSKRQRIAVRRASSGLQGVAFQSASQHEAFRPGTPQCTAREAALVRYVEKRKRRAMGRGRRNSRARRGPEQNNPLSTHNPKQPPASGKPNQGAFTVAVSADVDNEVPVLSKSDSWKSRQRLSARRNSDRGALANATTVDSDNAVPVLSKSDSWKNRQRRFASPNAVCPPSAQPSSEKKGSPRSSYYENNGIYIYPMARRFGAPPQTSTSVAKIAGGARTDTRHLSKRSSSSDESSGAFCMAPMYWDLP